VCAFREARDFPGHLKIVLQKSIPSGAGLGGGSSDAAGTLLALQSIWGYPLTPAELQQIAGKLGADVPFFLHPQTALMQGTGDVLTPAPHLHTRLARRKFLVFKPSFGISTVWAYEALAKEAAYQSDKEEDRFLADIVAAKKTLDELPFNAFRSIVDQRYPTIPVLLNTLNEQAEARAEMSGSGSACFAMYRSDDQSEAIQAHVRDAWGAEVFLEAVGIV
jgi:4-diphosphocytidyl-2-C-methyl-D-erythritol kinase